MPLFFLFDLFLEARSEILEKNFDVFLGDLKTPKGHSEINWPLSRTGNGRTWGQLTWKLELDFYFRFVKTVRHFRNGAKVGVLLHGVRGGVPFRGSPQLKVRLPMEMDFLKSKEISLSNFQISRKFQQISEINHSVLERIWVKGSYLSQWLPQGERGPHKESKSWWIEIFHGGSH